MMKRGEPSSEGCRPESESKPKVCEQARPQLRRVGRGTRTTSAEQIFDLRPDGPAEKSAGPEEIQEEKTRRVKTRHTIPFSS